MPPAQIKISVPAKTMLCGEYDILTTGGQALALALNSYMHVVFTLVPQSSQISVVSDYWGHERSITSTSSADDLLTALVKELILPSQRVRSIEIVSQYSPSYGFGSSSALILALQTAKIFIAKGCTVKEYDMLTRDSLTDIEKNNLLHKAHSLQQRFQGQASGYDIATQWYGGLLKFQAESTGKLLKHQALPPQHLCEFVHIYVGGKGAGTSETLATTSDWIQSKNLYATIRKHTDELLISFLQALQQNELSALIAAVAAWRQVFALSPCFPKQIASRLISLQGCDKTWTFKTSGAGGEDALLLIGQHKHLQLADQTLQEHGWHAVAFQPDLEGLQIKPLQV